jgi:hypothetical protein
VHHRPVLLLLDTISGQSLALCTFIQSVRIAVPSCRSATHIPSFWMTHSCRHIQNTAYIIKGTEPLQLQLQLQPLKAQGFITFFVRIHTSKYAMVYQLPKVAVHRLQIPVGDGTSKRGSSRVQETLRNQKERKSLTRSHILMIIVHEVHNISGKHSTFE